MSVKSKKSLAPANVCLYNGNMNTELTTIIIQHRKNYRFLPMQPSMMSHVRQADPVAGDGKENSAVPFRAEFVTALLQTADASLCSRF